MHVLVILVFTRKQLGTVVGLGYCAQPLLNKATNNAAVVVSQTDNKEGGGFHVILSLF